MLELMKIEEKINRLGESLRRNPGDIDVAWNYWRGLGDIDGCDVRSGRYVVEAFGQATLDSYQGAVAFAKAYRELVDLSGERPRRQYVNEKLITAIREAIERTDGLDKQLLRWIVESVETDA